MVCLSIAFISCSKDKNQDPLQDLQNKSMTYKEFFETVSEKSVDFVPNEKVLLVSYKLNKEDNTVTFLSSIIAESSWGVGLMLLASTKTKKFLAIKKIIIPYFM